MVVRKRERLYLPTRRPKNCYSLLLSSCRLRSVPSGACLGGVYAAYLRAAGSILVAPLVLLFLVLSQAANIVTSLWLSWWTAQQFGNGVGFYVSDPASNLFLQPGVYMR